ncbi:efflux RND transporter periplasmic adaptor subunit [Bradyrhizobium sp.]|uniref:efflux RND transporter periplasmic adaptor subunit n=1 Tax=Bradyrhizobium sp. TaxID=376 RepID=UPI003C5A2186
MSEGVVTDASQQKVSGKVVSIPVTPSIGNESKAGRPGRHWLMAGIAALLVAGIASATWWMSAKRSAVHYVTAQVTRGPVTRTVAATGTVNPELTIIVGSYVSGVIQEIYCDYNTRVKKGEVCAKIDPRPYETLVAQAKANLSVGKAQLQKDQANLAYTRINHERNAQMVVTHAVSQDVADQARNAYEQAQAQIVFDQGTIQQQEAALDSAQVNLDYTNIVSPVDGTVVSRSVTMGQTVAASFQTPTLFLIASDLKMMEVDTNVSESDIGGLKEGNAASFTVDAFPQRTFNGTISQLRQSPQTVQNVVTFDVVVSVDNSSLALQPGMTAATRLIIDSRSDVIRVPSQALRYGQGGQVAGAAPQGAPQSWKQLWLLRDGKPVASPVEAGLDDDAFTEIVAGDVKPGDQVILAEQRQASAGTLPPPRL